MEIKNRYTGKILFSGDYETMRECVNAALCGGIDLSRADLSEANLRGADLSEANLRGANLSWANLSWADFSRADLSGADLSRADLSWADFSRADFSGADLSEANLSGADLREADLRGADLSEANLSWANLSGANLQCVAGAIQWQAPQGCKRICLSVAHGDKVMHKIGCFWGDTDEAAAAIIKKYGENSLYEKIMRLNAEALK